MHVCPMQTPAVVPIPHVGGPILGMCVPTVLVEGIPASVVGDFCVCVGPPDVIVMGSMTVLIAGRPAARVGDMTAHGGTIVAGAATVFIGDAGGGAGSPAAATMSSARAQGAAFTQTNCARDAVLAALADSPVLAVGDPNKPHFIEIELFDQNNKPVARERFRIVAPDRKPFEGFLDQNGFARIDGIDSGTCVVSFPALDAASWKPETGDPGRVNRPVPDPQILPSIGPVRLTTIKGTTAPSIGPVRLTSNGVTFPSIAAVTVRTFTGVPEPSIGPVTLQVLRGNLVRLLAPSVRSLTVQLKVLGGPGIKPPTVKLAILEGPGIKPPTVKLAILKGPGIKPPTVKLAILKGPGIKPPTVTLRITQQRRPGVKLDSITVRPLRG